MCSRKIPTCANAVRMRELAACTPCAVASGLRLRQGGDARRASLSQVIFVLACCQSRPDPANFCSVVALSTAKALLLPTRSQACSSNHKAAGISHLTRAFRFGCTSRRGV
ncbi:hypothetical protein K437DRAFT_161943 [Tilletiaria anomala UBC 951]|uniref:Uncharacterized protein n=1 Tax=Tilletiaria anomala (strain ATCC 24038 / CBS 436.72 / UBC 951) TaxID=1037660 RepID=A0A066WFE3_TILAU|nr:uncharacterized protein K437DRAFT_161943 [Tilletiaria anomala UBC 951]KDN52697.1 hypothetical protein K437DRAFT_161943 [Tilletiaria anomala UBC 951]